MPLWPTMAFFIVYICFGLNGPNNSVELLIIELILSKFSVDASTVEILDRLLNEAFLAEPPN